MLNNISTCCEGQATRALGSLPEYIVSFAPEANAVYLNLFTDATVSLAPLTSVRESVTRGASSEVKNEERAAELASLRVATTWPYSPNVSVEITLPTTMEFAIVLRIPSWLADESNW